MSQRKSKSVGRGHKNLKTGSSFIRGNTSSRMIIACTGVLIITGVLLFISRQEIDTGTPEIIVYKSSSCNCCNKWVDHLRAAGFSVTARDTADLDHIKLSMGIRPTLQSCHTALAGDYLIEGHVPADDIKRLLLERPAISGLTVPGMPVGSPGMEGAYSEPFDVLTFDRTGKTMIYSSYGY